MSLTIVSNRLPVVVGTTKDGPPRVEPGSGGLVSALEPVLRHRGGTWIGWPGATDVDVATVRGLLAKTARSTGYGLVPVTLSREQIEDYYHGFSNEVIWPLFHDMTTPCNFDSRYWEAYLSVNRTFAEAAAGEAASEDLIWVHDYHLMAAGAELRTLRNDCKTAFFLHIPFPGVDVFSKLPWRSQVLEQLLGYDFVGFQTPRDRRNFLQCVRALQRRVNFLGRGASLAIQVGERVVRSGSFPIGIDAGAFGRLANDKNVQAKAEGLRRDESGRQFVLGVDRLDYSKGIPERLLAFRRALELYPDLRGRITLFQVVIPSREEIPEYAELKQRIERLVGKINGEFTRSGWVPIHYVFRSLPRPKLVAYYLCADIALVTPLKDGMNLVAKEYCASNVRDDGVLILSEFAGAAVQLQRGALLVNPHDIDGVAHAIARAANMGPGERRLRMRRLRASVQEQDVFRWVGSFLDAAFDRDLEDFPLHENPAPTQPAEEDLLAQL